MKRLLTYCTIMLFSLGASSQDYVDRSADYGVTGTYGVPVFDGSGGVSTVDFNQDGLDDLTFAASIDDEIFFYQNMGNDSFQLLVPSLITNTDEVKGILWFDYDNDGDPDIVTAAYDGPNRLYENTGNLTFTQVTVAAGLPMTNSSSCGITAADYDRDGDLDLYVCNYGIIVAGGPNIPDTNFMYRNNGDGTFTDVTGFTGTADSTRQSWCATFFDYNNDGWEDLYVANDRPEFRDALYENNGDGTFTDVTFTAGCLLNIYSMNSGVGDYDNNGFLDIYVTNIFPSTLHQNLGNGTFQDVATPAGVIFDRIGWGGTFFDYDNDLDLDLYVCSSRTFPTEPNAFYVNQGNGTFTEPYFTSGGLGGNDNDKSHANVVGDFNNDGKWDLAVSQDNIFFFRVWENVNVNDNHWFKLKLEGTSSNRDAIGSWLEIWIDGQKYIRTTHTHNSFWAQQSHTMIIGTGEHAYIDSLVIKWPYPSGGLPYTKEVIPGAGIQMGAVNTIVEGAGCDCSEASEHLVTSGANDGPGSLRAVIDAACICDTIRFDASLQNDTISLSGLPLNFDKSLVIDGSQSGIVLEIGDITSAWTIPYGVHLALNELEILDGAATAPDPLITNHGIMIMDNVILTSQILSGSERFIESTGVLTQRGVIEIRKE